MISQENRLAWIKIGKIPETLLLERATCVERLSEPFTIVANVITEKKGEQIDLLPLLGERVHIGMKQLQDPGISRHFDGVLFEAEEIGESTGGLQYQLVIRPWFWLLAQNLNSRIFQNLNVLDIVRKVLGDAGATDGYKIRCTGTYKPREYCVQFRESDFAFVSRLLEEEGIHYYFVHSEDGHIMHIADDSSGNPAIKGAFPFIQPNSEFGADREAHLSRWTEHVSPGAKLVTFRDSNFETPDDVFQGTKTAAPSPDTQKLEKGPAEQAEIYDYRGGYGRFGPIPAGEVKNDYAKRRLEVSRAERRKLTGEGTAFAIQCGHLFEVEDPNKVLQVRSRGKFLAIGAAHSIAVGAEESGGSGGIDVSVHVEAIPCGTPWRPRLRMPRPAIHGLQTATVVGKQGEPIWVDKYGRVIVQFPWDREGKFNETSSCWMRVTQFWADDKFGSMTIPRVGEEVLVDFMDGDPDMPVIVGRVYNAKNMPSLDLPAKNTQSTWRSKTVGTIGAYKDASDPPKPGSIGFNEIRYEDKGGEEEIYIHAQRDMSTEILYDEARKTGHDTLINVGHDRKVEIKNNETLLVQEGDETHTVAKGSRTSVVHAKDKLTVETGDSTTEVSQGDYSLKVSKGQATIEAAKQILLKVGNNTITISQQGIEINGLTVKIEGKTTLEAKGGLTGKLEAGTLLTLQGMPIKIN